MFSKFLIRQANVYRCYNKNSSLGLDPPNQKTTSLLTTIKLSLNIQVNKVLQLCVLKTTNLGIFSSTILSYSLISSSLQKSSTKTIAEYTTSTRTDMTLRTYVKDLIVLMTCSNLERDYRQEHSIFKFLEMCYFSNKMCSLSFCALKKSFNFLAKATISLLKARIRVRWAIIPGMNKQFAFFC